MKFLTTDKEIKANYNTILRVGYCELQTLLNYATPIAYTTSKVNGWKADFYKVGNVIISTGYHPIGKLVSYKLCQKYETLAEKEWSASYEKDYNKNLKEELEKLQKQFVKEAIQEA